MQLPPEAILQFQKLAEERGTVLSYEEAETEAKEWLNLYALARGVKNVI